MENELLKMFTIFIELIVAGGFSFILFMIVQLISYRIFGFNLYKWLNKNLLK